MVANGVENYQFKVKHSEVKTYPLCLDNTSKDFTVNNMKTELSGYVYGFYVDYDKTDISDLWIFINN